MTSHPRRRPRGGTAPPPELLRKLRDGALLTQTQAAALVYAKLKTWQAWEHGARRMPAATMELWCIALAVGTVAHGPYIAPGDWMLPWVRNELALWFRRPSPIRALTSTARPSPAPAAESATPVRT